MGPEVRAIAVTQEPIGRNARSNAATYTGLADEIRSLFAAAAGGAPARFSFNRPEGACESCEGIGAVELKLPYVPSEWIACEACGGRRFRPETLEVEVPLADGVRRSVADVFDLSVDEATLAPRRRVRRPDPRGAPVGRAGLPPARPGVAVAVGRRGPADQAREAARDGASR